MRTEPPKSPNRIQAEVSAKAHSAEQTKHLQPFEDAIANQENFLVWIENGTELEILLALEPQMSENIDIDAAILHFLGLQEESDRKERHQQIVFVLLQIQLINKKRQYLPIDFSHAKTYILSLPQENLPVYYKIFLNLLALNQLELAAALYPMVLYSAASHEYKQLLLLNFSFSHLRQSWLSLARSAIAQTNLEVKNQLAQMAIDFYQECIVNENIPNYHTEIDASMADLREAILSDDLKQFKIEYAKNPISIHEIPTEDSSETLLDLAIKKAKTKIIYAQSSISTLLSEEAKLLLQLNEVQPGKFSKQHQEIFNHLDPASKVRFLIKTPGKFHSVAREIKVKFLQELIDNYHNSLNNITFANYVYRTLLFLSAKENPGKTVKIGRFELHKDFQLPANASYEGKFNFSLSSILSGISSRTEKLLIEILGDSTECWYDQIKIYRKSLQAENQSFLNLSNEQEKHSEKYIRYQQKESFFNIFEKDSPVQNLFELKNKVEQALQSQSDDGTVKYDQRLKAGGKFFGLFGTCRARTLIERVVPAAA